jgi:hypothetical protein
MSSYFAEQFKVQNQAEWKRFLASTFNEGFSKWLKLNEYEKKPYEEKEKVPVC